MNKDEQANFMVASFIITMIVMVLVLNVIK